MVLTVTWMKTMDSETRWSRHSNDLRHLGNALDLNLWTTSLTAHPVLQNAIHSSINIVHLITHQWNMKDFDLTYVWTQDLDAHTMLLTCEDFTRWCRGSTLLQSKYKFYNVFRSGIEWAMMTTWMAAQHSALPWAWTMMGSQIASFSRTPTLPADFEMPSAATAAYRIHAVHAHAHADAASPSPCSPAYDASAPAHILHACASVSPNAQGPDHLLWILRQICLEGYALKMAST